MVADRNYKIVLATALRLAGGSDDDRATLRRNLLPLTPTERGRIEWIAHVVLDTVYDVEREVCASPCRAPAMGDPT